MLICCINISAQGSVTMPTTEAFFERIYIDGMKESLNYSDIEGSAYVDSEFHKALLNDNHEDIMARYNSYKDQVEFKKNDKIYVLEKNKNLSQIKFLNNNNVLVFLDLNGKEGYFYELYNSNGKVLLKKISTSLHMPEKNKNSYSSSDVSPEFITQINYFIKFNNTFYQIPLKRKKIYDLFPSRKDELISKCKTLNINLDNEQSLIKLMELL